MLELTGITAGYDHRAPVVRGAHLSLAPGESLGLLGPSGCGKSTLAGVAALLHRPDRGTVAFDGRAVTGFRHRRRAPCAPRSAWCSSSPGWAADPRLRLREFVAEPLRATGRRGEVDSVVPELADRVGLGADLLGRRPHEVSAASCNGPEWQECWCSGRAGWCATR